MDLSRVNWSAATVELADEHHRTNSSRARRTLAAASSLRGRFSDDYAIAAASVRAAIRLEPLDPIHRVRDVLVQLRFGDLDGALARLEALPEPVADLPLVLVVKALVTTRRGEMRTARNIADRALQVDPKHAGARFLFTDAQLHASTKGGLDKLGELPRGAAYDAAWADLLSRLAIVRPGDERAVTQHLDRGTVTKGSRAEAITRTVTRWSGATVDELIAAAEQQAPGSRAEQVALGLLVGELAAGTGAAAAAALQKLYMRSPERPAIRRALVAALGRFAVEQAADEKFAVALRVVQMCIELEPAEPIHHQNRAALFTLLGEHEAALDAWAELDRHHYRLALLGRLDAASARRYAAPHRMFSEASRIAANRGGVFVLETEGQDRHLAVNQEAIDRDPEQLRQWLHHTRAALVFGHVALGRARDRVLLAPQDPGTAEARADALCSLAQSLAVLVPDEGRRLADVLVARFREAAVAAPVRYKPVADDPDVLGVHRFELETFAELALLCLRWEPDPARRGLFDEVLETVRAVAPCFDERVLAGLLEEQRDDVSALRFLDRAMRVVLEIDRRDAKLDPMQRRRFIGFLAANLRVSLVARRVIESSGEISQYEIEQLIEQLELARKDDPKSARLEHWAAQLLLLGDFLDEAVAAIAAFHAIAKGDHELAPRIERIGELIEEKRKHGRNKKRAASGAAVAAPRDDRDIAAHEADLEVQPTSMPLYIELCHELAAAGRWREAASWSDRALARCLTPAGQLRARELNLELIGLEILGARDAGAVRSFVAGARAGALPALLAIGNADSPSALEYVRGLCLLAADRRADAQAAFVLALQRCTRGIHFAVLRPLAKDVETAVLEATRKELDVALAEHRFKDAFARLAELIATVAKPEVYLLELARVQLAAILPTVGTGEVPQAPSAIRSAAPWQRDLALALALPDAQLRTRAIVELAARVHEPSARDAAALIRKLDDLEEQLAVASALDESTKRATAGDYAGALAKLGDVGPAGDRNARVLRQRAIVLLRLERFPEADAATAALAALPEPVAREFAARYPGLKFRQQVSAASAVVRGNDFAKARTLLAAMVAAGSEQELELAYCRAYCSAAEGYRKHTDGDRVEASRLLFEALRIVEQHLAEARTHNHDRLIALHVKLDADIAEAHA